ncbi:MAG: sigma-70 family RNA polymerase sigma factor [Planctomycetes bacterium]|nr:sigma-70 family RNA polymerase sigma factor [Planctomycetota bacterium]
MEHSGKSLDDPKTTTSLLQDLRSSTSLRWADFVEIYSPLLLYWFRKNGVAEQFLEDLLQDTLLHVSNSIERFERRSDGGSFRGWLRTLVRNKSVDFFRSHHATFLLTEDQLMNLVTPVGKDELDLEKEEEAIQQLKSRAMQVARCHVSASTWEMFWLSVTESHSTAEIAHQYQVTPAAFRVAKARVLKLLRSILHDIR